MLLNLIVINHRQLDIVKHHVVSVRELLLIVHLVIHVLLDSKDTCTLYNKSSHKKNDNFSKVEILKILTNEEMDEAFKIISSPDLNTSQALEKINSEIEMCDEINYLLNFINNSTRGITK